MPTIRLQPLPVYFMHIQKTAGTSLQMMFRFIFGRHSFMHVPISRLCAVDLNELQVSRCWQSHCGPGLRPFLPQRDLHLVTMLREPVERMISHIYFVRGRMVTAPKMQHPAFLEQVAQLADADLRAWLAHPSSVLFDNFQTRYLGTQSDLAPWFKTGEFGTLKKRLLFPTLPASLTDDNDMSQVFSRACKQLDEMHVVGRTERFSESVQLICGLLGVPVPVNLPDANVGPTKGQVQVDYHRRHTPPDLIEQVKARNYYDLQLYDYACDLFKEQLARRRTQPKRTYCIAPRLRLKANRSLSVISQTAKTVAPPLAGNAQLRRVNKMVRTWFG